MLSVTFPKTIVLLTQGREELNKFKFLVCQGGIRDFICAVDRFSHTLPCWVPRAWKTMLETSFNKPVLKQTKAQKARDGRRSGQGWRECATPLAWRQSIESE